MSRDTAVLLLKYALQPALRHGIVLGEQDADCEPNPMIKQPVDQIAVQAEQQVEQAQVDEHRRW